MIFVLSGGGTAGHINPALALAEELLADGHYVYFAGTPNGVEARLVPQAGIPFEAFEASGINRRHPTTVVKAIALMQSSTGKAKKWLASIQADCAVCFGGYVSIPVGRAAQRMGIPLVVHEQNSVMGMANRYLSKRAQRICLTYEAAASQVADVSKVVLTGNPVRRSLFETTRVQGRAYCRVPENALMLLVFGGSLGARHINTAICALKEKLLSRENLYVYHISGPKEYESVCAALTLSNEEAQRWRIVSYEDNMAAVLVAADAVVSRAGATSLAEISGLGIPALLVPYPYATADHQSANAASYVEAGAAFLVADGQVESNLFAQKLFDLVDSADVRASMKAAAGSFETRHAAQRLARVVVKAAQG